MSIDEAVEAALMATSYVMDDLKALSEREGISVHMDLEGVIRAALEAAAPYMLAPRYGLGGFLESGVSQVTNTSGKPISIQPNPHRSQHEANP